MSLDGHNFFPTKGWTWWSFKVPFSLSSFCDELLPRMKFVQRSVTVFTITQVQLTDSASCCPSFCSIPSRKPNILRNMTGAAQTCTFWFWPQGAMQVSHPQVKLSSCFVVLQYYVTLHKSHRKSWFSGLTAFKCIFSSRKIKASITAFL